MAKRDASDSESEEDASSSSSDEDVVAAEEETAVAATAGKGVSEYEKQRLSRIAENKARLDALGLTKMASSLKGLAGSNKNKGKGKEKVDDDDDDDEEYRPNEEEPPSESSSHDDDDGHDTDEDFVVGNASGSRKRKQVTNKSLKAKAKVSGKKLCTSNSEYIDDDDEALRQAIALSLQDIAEASSDKHVKNITKAEKKGNIHIEEHKGRKKSKKSFASRLQMTEDELIVHFFQLDEAGKGTVTIRDLQRAAIAHDFMWTDEELVDMIRCFDSDGDGKLSLEDFRKIVVRCNMIKGS